MGYGTEILLEKPVLGSLSGCLHSRVCQASSYCPPQMFKAKTECWVWFAGSRIPKAQETVLEALINAGGSFQSLHSGDWRTEQMLSGNQVWRGRDSGQGKTLLA